MARSYHEIMAERDARLSPEAREYGKVLTLAYDLAMQFLALRDKRGLTHAELAERCGVDQADSRRIERGEMTPDIYTLQRVVDALGAEVRLVEKASSSGDPLTSH